VLKGCLPAKLVALLNIRNCSKDTVQQLARVQMLSPVNAGRPSDINSLVMVQLRGDASEFTWVDIGTILSLANRIPEGNPCWLVNSRIDFSTFKEIHL